MRANESLLCSSIGFSGQNKKQLHLWMLFVVLLHNLLAEDE
jgi:hypothetical protein